MAGARGQRRQAISAPLPRTPGSGARSPGLLAGAQTGGEAGGRGKERARAQPPPPRAVQVAGSGLLPYLAPRKGAPAWAAPAPPRSGSAGGPAPPRPLPPGRDMRGAPRRAAAHPRQIRGGRDALRWPSRPCPALPGRCAGLVPEGDTLHRCRARPGDREPVRQGSLGPACQGPGPQSPRAPHPSSNPTAQGPCPSFGEFWGLAPQCYLRDWKEKGDKDSLLTRTISVVQDQPPNWNFTRLPRDLTVCSPGSDSWALLPQTQESRPCTLHGLRKWPSLFPAVPSPPTPP